MQYFLRDIFTQALSIEIYGQEYYAIFSDLVPGTHAQRMFIRLSTDENEHREILEHEFEKISGHPIDLKVLDQEQRERARAIFPESLEPFDMNDHMDVLNLGIRTEERSIDLYSRGAEGAGTRELKELFTRLEHFEKRHKAILEQTMAYLKEEGTWQNVPRIVE